MKRLFFLLSLAVSIVISSCGDEGSNITPIKPPVKSDVDTSYIRKAEFTLNKIFEHYWHSPLKIMYDKHPNIKATDTNTSDFAYDKGYAFVWGYGAILSGYNTLFQHSPWASEVERTFKSRIIEGLEIYYNTDKRPPSYACFGNSWDDRFYDDNVWIGIDLIELYQKTHDAWFLNKAKEVWTFIMSGKDDVLGGGVYWKEGEKDSKNTCSNAPVAVFGVKLYQATNEAQYLTTAKEIYTWTKSNLQDPLDLLYWDCIKTNGEVEKAKFAYNSGQMLQAAVLLYNATSDKSYLTQAEEVAAASYNYFFESYTLPTGENITVLKPGSLWFNSIMFRGFVELHQVHPINKYMSAFRQSLNQAWLAARDSKTGLLSADVSGRNQDAEKDLLTQGAYVEMFARMAAVK